ncbi:SspB family protein [Labrys monachus]|uniref:Stringent starvation protein B n=1 Tax=Labrys monachus TaxID=217067 RepID=A0ABU0FM70_9HYPH|nr:ClpXP protease specificity-enhancing factor SspB [Labrys monachus]MDQ0395234.1 hypothetical protein [Labrys monachus]
MSTDHIRYDLLTQDALRGMVRRVLADVARVGLPGDHHFFISFKTQYPGVSIPVRLAEKFPEEITIVLQHQFWDLAVSDFGFEVGLSFGNAPERLVVPFDAVTAFFDPSVEFGVKFEVADIDHAAADGDAEGRMPIRPLPLSNAATEPADKPAAKALTKKPARSKVALTEGTERAAPARSESPPADNAASEGEKIVSLDHFRKKK